MGVNCDNCQKMKRLFPHLYGQNTIEDLHVLHKLADEALATADKTIPREQLIDKLAVEIAEMSPTVVRMSEHFRQKDDDLLEVPEYPQLPVTAGLIDSDGDGIPDYRDRDAFEWSL